MVDTATPPPAVLSHSTVAETEATLNRYNLLDPNLTQKERDLLLAQRAVLDRAKLETGYQPPAPLDPATAAQQRADREWGMPAREPQSYSLQAPIGYAAPEGTTEAEVLDGARLLASELQFSPELAQAITTDMLSTGDVDAAQVKALFDATGRDYANAIADVDAMLRSVPDCQISAEDLPAMSLVQLSVFAEHRARWQASRR